MLLPRRVAFCDRALEERRLPRIVAFCDRRLGQELQPADRMAAIAARARVGVAAGRAICSEKLILYEGRNHSMQF
jgi:hypothetical protein